jgi:EAL and modified HD-GYP domain-containing signal transduction protein
LVVLADIIKIDFRKESMPKIQLGVKKLRQYRAKLLAEKIETEEEFQAALCFGFDYFQGNFCSKAEIISADRLSSELDYLISEEA